MGWTVHFLKTAFRNSRLNGMPPPLIGELGPYIGPNSRTERHRKTKIGTEVAHVTGD